MPHREACLPPLPCLVRHQRRLAGLRLVCSTPKSTLSRGRLPKNVPTFFPNRALPAARGKITNKLYIWFNLDWPVSADEVKNLRYYHNTITTLANMAPPLLHAVATLSPISLHLTDYLSPIHPVVPSSAKLKIRAKQHLLSDWASAPSPAYYPYTPSVRPHPFIARGDRVAGRVH